MHILEGFLIVIVAWYVLGVINVAFTQAFIGDHVFSQYQRNSTLWLLYALAPPMFIVFVVYGLSQYPIKLGTRYGRRVGRFIHDADA
jgi:hypothetical protein